MIRASFQLKDARHKSHFICRALSHL